MNPCEEFLNGFAAMLKNNKQPEGFRWPSLYHFLAETAKTMPLPAVLAERQGLIKECFRNSTEAVMREPDGHIAYCEGYAMPDGIPLPMAHAWLLDLKERCVIETTWDKPGVDYFGIAFTRKYTIKATIERKHYGLIDAWESDFPLLRMTPEELGKVIHPVMGIIKNINRKQQQLTATT